MTAKTAAGITAKLKEYAAVNVLDCMDDTLIRLVGDAETKGSLTLAEILDIVYYELCMDGE